MVEIKRWRVPASVLGQGLIQGSLIDNAVAKTAERVKSLLGRGKAVPVGGFAMSMWAVPRYTQDVDILSLSTILPTQAFRTHRRHAMEDKDTGVEVEILTPDLFPDMPLTLFRKVVDTAIETSDGFWVATPPAMVALKSYRMSMQDKADIVALFKHNLSREEWPAVLTEWPVRKEALEEVLSLLSKE